MEADPRSAAVRREAAVTLAPGPLIRIGSGPLSVEIAPAAGGRIAQVTYAGIEQLVGHGAGRTTSMMWGSFPMVPWAGRIRHGRFAFQGVRHQLPINLDDHAAHGVAFEMPWRVDAHSSVRAELSLALPDDARWPFGGTSRQCFEVGENWLRMRLSATAGAQAMPFTIGWHPWFRKPDRIDFSPAKAYPRDAEGIATLPLVAPPAGPWDDCFVNRDPVVLHRAGQTLRLTSDCHHWVVYDEPAHGACVEPQSGPPDGLNLSPGYLAPGASKSVWFLLEWL